MDKGKEVVNATYFADIPRFQLQNIVLTCSLSLPPWGLWFKYSHTVNWN